MHVCAEVLFKNSHCLINFSHDRNILESYLKSFAEAVTLNWLLHYTFQVVCHSVGELKPHKTLHVSL